MLIFEKVAKIDQKLGLTPGKVSVKNLLTFLRHKIMANIFTFEAFPIFE